MTACAVASCSFRGQDHLAINPCGTGTATNGQPCEWCGVVVKGDDGCAYCWTLVAIVPDLVNPIQIGIKK